MNQSQQKLHFSIGPVQGFVGSSRRTRDLWASSYLLSYLAGKAIVALREEFGAKMVLPDIEGNRLIEALGGDDTATTPRHGTVPNRFVAKVDSPKDAAEAAAGAVDRAWKEVAEAVWNEYLEPIAHHGDKTRQIWKRQRDNFWQISWAVGDDPSTLDRRKNWRSHAPPDEEGDKCTMMHRHQELSGYVRAQNRSKQDKFWARVKGRVGALDLKDDERLCTIAFVKRMYPRVADELFGWTLDVDHWPSTAYLAAAPWVAGVASESKAVEYANNVLNTHSRARGEWGTSLPCLEGVRSDFASLDGNFFLDEALSNENATSLDGADDGRTALVEELRELYGEFGQPSRYYALLLMDGDKMGALLRDAHDEGNTSAVSNALGEFAQSVDDIVSTHDGLAVYAGGDDVMAVMTLPNVLSCALELRTRYRDCFEDVALDRAATVSAGIVYAHYKTPLREVLAEAHRLLDDVAKDRTGRDSVAISAMKPSGKQVEWTTPFLHLTNASTTAPHRLDALRDCLATGDDEKGFTNSFFYGLRRALMALADEPRWEPGTYVALPEAFDLSELVVSQYMQADPGLEESRAREDVETLLDASRRVTRDSRQQQIQHDESTIGFDASLLVKFLDEELRQWDPNKEGRQ